MLIEIRSGDQNNSDLLHDSGKCLLHFSFKLLDR